MKWFKNKKNWNNLQDRIKIIQDLAEQENWQFICHQMDNVMLSFGKSGVRINIYYTKMTVGTCMDHPTKGKTQLFRKWVSENELLKILKDPRIHTQKGYYQK